MNTIRKNSKEAKEVLETFTHSFYCSVNSLFPSKYPTERNLVLSELNRFKWKLVKLPNGEYEIRFATGGYHSLRFDKDA